MLLFFLLFFSEMHDTVPDIIQNSDGFSVRVKYAPFNTVVSKASQWLNGQEVSVLSVSYSILQKLLILLSTVTYTPLHFGELILMNRNM